MLALPNCSGPCMNVLYLLSDDMRANWGTYGLPTKTPNLDRLAAEGLLFTHAYCQMSVCSPSRQSFMTSRRPDKNKVWNFLDHNPLSTQATPGHFRDAGYLALGLGKTFHENGGAWNADRYWSTDARPYYPYSANTCPIGGEGGGHCVEEDDKIYDYRLRLAALDYLGFAAETWRNTSRPFYMMVGFRDPHAPWAAPQRMYDLYDEASLAGPTHTTLDPSQPLIAWSDQLSVQLQNGTHFPFSPQHAVPDWVQRDQRHAYYAAISYVDEHIGALLARLDSEGLERRTIVVMHADHGYQLGEHGIWEKKSNFDLAVRVPLLVKVPGKPRSYGKKTASLTELVDVFPTLAALAGLPPPAGVDGTDVSALFDQPDAELKPAAFHQYPACGMAGEINRTRGGCNQTPRGQFDFMGYTVRTVDWRYTLWLPWDQQKLVAEWDAREDPDKSRQELYEHHGDDSSSMDRWENVNVAASQPDVAARLRSVVHDFFTRDGPSRRLVINGSTIALPEAPTVPIALRGFNWDFSLMHSDLDMGNVTAADRAVSTLFPGATLARLVMVHWHDDGTTKSGRDCSANDASTGYLTAACLAQFDDVLHWATREAKLWAVVTMRSALAAGDGGPNGTVFDNATLAAEAAAMWGFLAARYRDWDNICGYEVLSEPRADVAASVVHAYHELACGAVWAADPRAACIVGPTRFYNRYHLGPEYLMEPGRPTIYAANFFEPGLWIGGQGAAAALPYGATARCCDLAEEKSCGGSCDGGGGTVTLGRAWLATLLQPVLDFRAKYDVPVWVDQWGLDAGASDGDASRAAYLDDVLALLGDGGVHWTYWIWRSGYHTRGTSEAIYFGPAANGTYERFGTAVERLRGWL